MQLIYYGHSCFAVNTGNKKILFDPFITENPQAISKGINAVDIDADYILQSHGHDDHITDCVAIALANNAEVVCCAEISDWLNKQGVTKTHAMNIGGKRNFGDFTVKCVAAEHSSSFPDGSYAGIAMGFIVYAGNASFYYAGDTALTLDMQLIPTWANLNFAVLPIGDNFTMGYEDALEAAKMIDCKTIIGVHYDTFDLIKIEKEEKEKAIHIFSADGRKLLLPNVGEEISV